jgi:hypothetical protein
MSADDRQRIQGWRARRHVMNKPGRAASVNPAPLSRPQVPGSHVEDERRLIDLCTVSAAEPLVIQLLIIALVSGIIGELKSTAIVGAMVVLSVGLSFVLDRRSGKAVESLAVEEAAEAGPERVPLTQAVS